MVPYAPVTLCLSCARRTETILCTVSVYRDASRRQWLGRKTGSAPAGPPEGGGGSLRSAGPEVAQIESNSSVVCELMVHHSHLLFILAPVLRAIESPYLDFFQNEEQEQQFINAHSFMSAEWGTHGSPTRTISLVTPPLTTQSYEKQAHVHPRSHHSDPTDLRHPSGARVKDVS